MIDPPHIWSVIYIRESNRSHPPTSPNIAPATQKWISWLIQPDIWNVAYNARSKSSHPSDSQSIAPATEFWVQDLSEKLLNCFRQYPNNEIVQEFRAPAISQNVTKCCACHEKSQSTFTMQILPLPRKMNLMLDPRLTCEESFTMRGATRLTLQLPPILRPPRKNQSRDWSAWHMKRCLQCFSWHLLSTHLFCFIFQTS